MSKLEEITAPDGELIAIVVEGSLKTEGVNFISKPDFPLQLGVSSYKQGIKIKPHVHLNRRIVVESLQEVIYIKSGRTTVNLFDKGKVLFRSLTLSAGDLIFFVSGGHGFEMLEDTVLMEVKQGPYLGRDKDKELIV